MASDPDDACPLERLALRRGLPAPDGLSSSPCCWSTPLTAATSVRQQSITFDELAHLTGGVTAWLTSDYRLFPQNPQLPQRWAALPLVVGGIGLPSLDQPAWWSSDLEAIGYQLLYNSGNDHDAILWRARLAMIPIGVLLGWTCYVWGRALFGAAAGVVAVFVCVFSPSIIAHGPLATSDLTAALMFTVCLAAFWRVLHHTTAARLLLSVLATGLLFITKMSALLMIPVALALIAIRVARRRPMRWFGDRLRRPDSQTLAGRCAAVLGAHLVGIVIVIWASYGFRYTTFREAVPGRDQMFLECHGRHAGGAGRHRPRHHARAKHQNPSRACTSSAWRTSSTGRAGFPVFLTAGTASTAGGTSFVLLARRDAAVSVCASRSGRHRVVATRSLDSPQASCSARRLPAGAAACLSRCLLDSRPHEWPQPGRTPSAADLSRGVHPGWWGSGAGLQAWALATVAVGLLLLSFAIDSVRIGPHYLAYFNAVAGGPASGYRHLVDSSLDWGQDLPGLKQWIDRVRLQSGPHDRDTCPISGPATRRTTASTRCSYSATRTGGANGRCTQLTGGIYCVSATMLQSVYTRVPGPWAEPYESAYQRARLAVESGSPR